MSCVSSSIIPDVSDSIRQSSTNLFLSESNQLRKYLVEPGPKIELIHVKLDTLLPTGQSILGYLLETYWTALIGVKREELLEVIYESVKRYGFDFTGVATHLRNNGIFTALMEILFGIHIVNTERILLLLRVLTIQPTFQPNFLGPIYKVIANLFPIKLSTTQHFQRHHRLPYDQMKSKVLSKFEVIYELMKVNSAPSELNQLYSPLLTWLIDETQAEMMIQFLSKIPQAQLLELKLSQRISELIQINFITPTCKSCSLQEYSQDAVHQYRSSAGGVIVDVLNTITNWQKQSGSINMEEYFTTLISDLSIRTTSTIWYFKLFGRGVLPDEFAATIVTTLREHPERVDLLEVNCLSPTYAVARTLGELLMVHHKQLQAVAPILLQMIQTAIGQHPKLAEQYFRALFSHEMMISGTEFEIQFCQFLLPLQPPLTEFKEPTTAPHLSHPIDVFIKHIIRFDSRYTPVGTAAIPQSSWIHVKLLLDHATRTPPHLIRSRISHYLIYKNDVNGLASWLSTPFMHHGDTESMACEIFWTNTLFDQFFSCLETICGTPPPLTPNQLADLEDARLGRPSMARAIEPPYKDPFGRRPYQDVKPMFGLIKSTYETTLPILSEAVRKILFTECRLSEDVINYEIFPLLFQRDDLIDHYPYTTNPRVFQPKSVSESSSYSTID